MKKLAISCVSGLLFICQLAYGQTNSYKPVGYVNDFANLLDIQSKNNLESKLRDYKEKTSIEIAVVIVPSLDSLTVEEYTLNLAQRWGVGDKQKDNGVVLLVAPNERKVRIEVGYGMEPDLTDAQAGRIIQNVIIPHFRNQQMQEGILAGTNAVLDTLGSTPFEARLEERKAAEEKRLADEKRRNEETAAFMAVVGVVLLVLLVLSTGVFVIYKFFKNREELKNQHLENAKNLKKCTDLLDETDREYPKAQEKLSDLKKHNPKDVWQDFEKSLDKIPGNLVIKRKGLDLLKAEYGKSNWRSSNKLNAKIIPMVEDTLISSELLETIVAKIKEVHDAKDKSPVLLKELGVVIENAKEDVSHKDVSNLTKKSFDKAKEDYKKAQSLVDNQTVNWLVVYPLITGAIALVAQTKKNVKSDKVDAEEARKPKPKRRSSYDSPSSSYNSSSSWSSSSSSSSSGSSFGGFGGGSFGGGGASGSW